MDVPQSVKNLSRRCGACTLCCRLLPMSPRHDDVGDAITAMVNAGIASYADYAGARQEWRKPAGDRCRYQRHSGGCTIYLERPGSCRMWSCRWLTGADTASLSRPDRSHYVIDIMPDYVVIGDAPAKTERVPVVIVWLDPRFPDAHRDPALRAFLDRRGKEGMAALVRLDESRGFVLWPPSLADGQWHEIWPRMDSTIVQHDVTDIVDACGGIRMEFTERKGAR